MAKNEKYLALPLSGRFYRYAERRLGGGASETAFYDQPAGQLVAVISHPTPSAKWFLHLARSPGSVPCDTRKAAINALDLAHVTAASRD